MVDSGRGLELSWHIDSTKCDNKMRVGTVLHYFLFLDETINKIPPFHFILHLKEMFLTIRKLLPVKV
jgi:hypothetical protein